MIMFFSIEDVCTNPAVLKVILFVQKILDIIFFIVPIGLIVIASIDLAKNVMASESDMEKNRVIFIKRFIYAIFFFLVPVIVKFSLSLVDSSISNFNVNYQSCIENTAHISIYEQDAETERLREEREWQQYLEENINADDVFRNTIRSYVISNNSDGTSENNDDSSGSGDLVLDWSDVTKISNATSTQLTKSLNAYGGGATNFLPYINGLLQAEHTHKVNVFFLLGIEALESAWVTSRVSQECNNLGGVKFANQANATSCTLSPEGDYYAKFNRKEDFIDSHASLLEKSYLTSGGSYFRGTTPEAVVVSYCPGCSSWPSEVKSIGQGLFDKAKG